MDLGNGSICANEMGETIDEQQAKLLSVARQDLESARRDLEFQKGRLSGLVMAFDEIRRAVLEAEAANSKRNEF